MAKLLQIGGEFFRIRRGKYVKIPDEWAGRTTYRQTIRKRKDKPNGDYAGPTRKGRGKRR